MLSTVSKLQRAFRKEAHGKRGEVHLFQAFISAFNSVGADVLAKQYHGAKHQVTFHQLRGAGRPKPRCELCDVVIIHYPKDKPINARITFNQAKVSSKPFTCSLHSSLNAGYTLSANLEQWDLLSNRPQIRPATRKFQPPPDLLSGAILPSVGSFGVFYPVEKGFDFAYFVADGLDTVNNGWSRHGTLKCMRPAHQLRQISGYTEVAGACCLTTFWCALECSLIGTPVDQLLVGSTSQSELRIWLTDLLVTLRREHSDSELPEELIRGLELEQLAQERRSVLDGAECGPVKAVLLIRT